MEGESRVQEYYRGASVLVTGFSGFMGKVLVEKLLRSCHHLDKVYVIVRPKRGKTVQQRMEKLLETPLWERLVGEKPGVLEEKLVALEGDVSEVGLGLEPHQLATIRSSVAVIFHVAAAVAFDQPLDLALKANTLSTKNVVDLALDMPSLKCFVYVSTAYSNCDHKVVEERVYPSRVHWRQTLDIAATTDPQLIRILEPKFLGDMPNTYVFTKSLAENVVWEQRHKIPVIIFRPTIVTSSLLEPVPGWIDNFNGPFGLSIGFAMGLIRTVLLDPEVRPDSFPVDLATRAMIVAPTSPEREKDGMVYNASSDELRMTFIQAFNDALGVCEQNPMERAVWYPSLHMTKSRFWFKINVWYRHLILGLIVDTILRITNKKPMLLHVYRRYYKAMLVLAPFTNGEWEFENGNFLGLDEELRPADRADFRFRSMDLNRKKIIKINTAGAKKYLLKDTDANPEWNLKKARILYWLDLVVDCLKWFIVAWLLHRWGLFHAVQQLATSALLRLQ